MKKNSYAVILYSMSCYLLLGSCSVFVFHSTTIYVISYLVHLFYALFLPFLILLMICLITIHWFMVQTILINMKYKLVQHNVKVNTHFCLD